MDRRTFVKATLAAGSATALGVAPRFANAQAGKPATIAFFVKNVTNPFWKACRIGAEKAGKSLGVTVETVAPTKPDNIEEQTRLVEDWIVKKPNAFVFVPVDYKALVPSIQKVNSAGIPVVIYNNKMADVNNVTYVGSDDEVMEYEICKYLFKSMGDKGKVVHIDGVPAAITAQARKRGFERAVKETPGIEVLASQPGNYRRLPAVQVFENLMQRFKMFATADFSGHDQAYLAVTAAVRHLRGQPAPKEIMLPVVIVNKDNVNKFMKTPEDRDPPDWNAYAGGRA
jgi:ribose transport system substrate-binding protein